jgi:hypothetical protein
MTTTDKNLDLAANVQWLMVSALKKTEEDLRGLGCWISTGKLIQFIRTGQFTRAVEQATALRTWCARRSLSLGRLMDHVRETCLLLARVDREAVVG